MSNLQSVRLFKIIDCLYALKNFYGKNFFYLLLNYCLNNVYDW